MHRAVLLYIWHRDGAHGLRRLASIFSHAPVFCLCTERCLDDPHGRQLLAVPFWALLPSLMQRIVPLSLRRLGDPRGRRRLAAIFCALLSLFMHRTVLLCFWCFGDSRVRRQFRRTFFRLQFSPCSCPRSCTARCFNSCSAPTTRAGVSFFFVFPFARRSAR